MERAICYTKSNQNMAFFSKEFSDGTVQFSDGMGTNIVITMIQSVDYLANAMSKEWLILTGVGVEKSFPEGSNVEFGLRGSSKQREGGKTLKTGIGHFNKDAESGEK